MPDYSKGKIYKIADNTKWKYIHRSHYRTTTEPTIARRLTGHVRNYRQYQIGKHSSYETSFKIIKNGDYCIALLEEVNCSSKDELSAKKRYYIENNTCVNKVIAGRTLEEYKVQEHENICKREDQRNKKRIWRDACQIEIAKRNSYHFQS
ncbi:hypothetical protein EON65_26865 [archaeon]|nr:MAG: hypothetical protein EON65_26865 [archaeon]